MHLEMLLQTVFPVLLLIGGIINIIVGFYFYNRFKKKYDKYRTTNGVVVDIVEENGTNGTIIYPIIKFNIGRDEYTVKNSYGKYPWNIKRGDTVIINYNSCNHVEAEIETKMFRTAFPIIAWASAFAAFVMALILYLSQS